MIVEYQRKLESLPLLNEALEEIKGNLESANFYLFSGNEIVRGIMTTDDLRRFNVVQLQEADKEMSMLHWQLEQCKLGVQRNMNNAIELAMTKYEECNSLLPVPENRKVIVQILSFLPRSESVVAVSICRLWVSLKRKVVLKSARFCEIPMGISYKFWNMALVERELKLPSRYQNKLAVAHPQMYAKYLEKAIHNPAQDKELYQLIRKDVRRSTFDSGIGMNEAETRFAQASLEHVLMAYAEYDLDIGYCQGMTFIAATILVRLGFDEALSFEIFSRMMRIHRLREVFRPRLVGAKLRFDQLDNLISKNMTDLAELFAECGIEAHFYSPGWIMCLFTNHCGLSTSTVHRIIDIFITDGWKGLFRIILAIMELVRPMILEADKQNVLPIVMTIAKCITLENQNDIFQIAQRFKITDKYLASIEDANMQTASKKTCRDFLKRIICVTVMDTQE